MGKAHKHRGSKKRLLKKEIEKQRRLSWSESKIGIHFYPKNLSLPKGKSLIIIDLLKNYKLKINNQGAIFFCNFKNKTI